MPRSVNKPCIKSPFLSFEACFEESQDERRFAVGSKS